MLLGLHFDKDASKKERKALGEAIAKHANRRFRVVESKDLDEHYDLLNKYSFRKGDGLLLLNTHYDYEDELPTGYWRCLDLEFNRRGGVIFGEEPAQSSSVFRGKIVDDDYDHMLTSAEYHKAKAVAMFNEIPRGYFGRVDSDPHTILFGFVPSWKSLSTTAQALMAGLPEGDSNWWQGVAYVNRNSASIKETREELFQQALERFPYASRIAIEGNAEGAFETIEQPYQVTSMPRSKYLAVAEDYGRNLRMLSRLDSERVV